MMNAYANRRVLVTGHAGFKGTWLMAKLHELGAEAHGFSLPDDDVRNFDGLHRAVRFLRPHFVFHLAAQALVPVSFKEPLRTIETNVLGTANLLEALRREGRPCAVVVVTSDKCYLPCRHRDHVESDHLGGHDPYAASKASAEFVVTAYRDGFFAPKHGIAVATARAGNVIGGADWAQDRLIPNAIRALVRREPVKVWNPDATRPWQYVTDVIDGYLRLGAALASANHAHFCEAWNFGPDESHTVREVVEQVIAAWGSGNWVHEPTALRETFELRVDSTKARTLLKWAPQIPFGEAIRRTVDWYKTTEVELFTSFTDTEFSMSRKAVP
jgi:CDP-glucose 4,6-dehydratase